ncbi:MAG: hypothetical protein HY610_02530, partial [Elusimicrobia bacterium]|nr:hypothetical protein [Elusimicrobiota bacterium]
ISDCHVTWNGIPFQEKPIEAAREKSVRSRFSPDLITRVTVDELHIEELSESFTRLMPDSVRKRFLGMGGNLDFEAGTPLVRTRNSVQNPDRYQPRNAVLALKTVAQLYQSGQIDLPGLPRYEDYLQNSPWNGTGIPGWIYQDSAYLNSGEYETGEESETFWERFEDQYLKSPIHWAQLMLLIEPSLQTRRDELYSRFLPSSLVQELNRFRQEGIGLHVPRPKSGLSEPLSWQRENLYLHLVEYAALFLEGKALLRGLTFSEYVDSTAEIVQNPGMSRMAKRVGSGDWSALDELNLNNEDWQDLALLIQLPQLNNGSARSLIENLRVQSQTRRKTELENLGLGTDFSNDIGAQALTQLVEIILNATQSPTSDIVPINLKSGILEAFEVFVRESRIEPFLEKMLEVTHNDQTHEKVIEFYDAYLKSGITKAEILETLTRIFERTELESSLTELHRKIARLPSAVILATQVREVSPPNAGMQRGTTASIADKEIKAWLNKNIKNPVLRVVLYYVLTVIGVWLEVIYQTPANMLAQYGLVRKGIAEKVEHAGMITLAGITLSSFLIAIGMIAPTPSLRMVVAIPAILVWASASAQVFSGAHKDKTRFEKAVLFVVGFVLAGALVAPAIFVLMGLPIPFIGHISFPLIGKISGIGEAVKIGFALNFAIHSIYNIIALLSGGRLPLAAIADSNAVHGDVEVTRLKFEKANLLYPLSFFSDRLDTSITQLHGFLHRRRGLGKAKYSELATLLKEIDERYDLNSLPDHPALLAKLKKAALIYTHAEIARRSGIGNEGTISLILSGSKGFGHETYRKLVPFIREVEQEYQLDYLPDHEAMIALLIKVVKNYSLGIVAKESEVNKSTIANL